MRFLVVVLAGALALGGCSGDGEPPDPAPSTAGSPTASAEVVAITDSATVDVAAGPVGIAAGDGAVWVVSAEGETVARIPAGGRRPDVTVDAPGVPLRVAVG